MLVWQSKDAYVILGHRNPWQINALAVCLSAAGHDVYIHVDAASPIACEIRCSERIRLVRKHVAVSRGAWSVVQAELNSMRQLVVSGKGCRYVHLLSGQCLPAMSLARLDAVLESILHSDRPQLLHYFSLPVSTLGGQGGLHRVRVRYPQGMVSKFSPWHRLFWKYTSFFLFLGLSRLGYARFRLFYAGSQWWSLTLDAVRDALRYGDEHPDYERFFHLCFCSDELYIQDALIRCGYQAEIDVNLRRFIKWDQGKTCSPVELTPADLPEILACEALFARKFNFSPSETEVYLQALENA